MDLSDYRKDYLTGHIVGAKHTNPIHWFEEWLNEAIESNELEPTAMVVSTVSEHNLPSSRVVLLKGFSNEGFIFYTNYSSRKGSQIKGNNAVSAVFFWPATERQIRIEGNAVRLSNVQSDEYFNSRPFESKINAIISPQSEPIPSRDMLEQKHDELLNKSDSQNLTRPENWGGYRIEPRLIEFWQGRTGRLHDRIEFQKQEEKWISRRLAP